MQEQHSYQLFKLISDKNFSDAKQFILKQKNSHDLYTYYNFNNEGIIHILVKASKKKLINSLFKKESTFSLFKKKRKNEHKVQNSKDIALHTPNIDGYTPILLAALQGDIEIFKILIKESQNLFRNSDNNLVEQRTNEILEILKPKTKSKNVGGAVNKKRKADDDAEMYAIFIESLPNNQTTEARLEMQLFNFAFLKDYTNFIKILTENGAVSCIHIDKANNNSIFHLLSIDKNIDIKILTTPLMRYNSFLEKECIQFLEEDLKKYRLESPNDNIKITSLSDINILISITQEEIKKNPQAKTDDSKIPKERLKFLKSLLLKFNKFNSTKNLLNTVNTNGYSPLLIAAYNENNRVFEILKSYNANFELNFSNEQGLKNIIQVYSRLIFHKNKSKNMEILENSKKLLISPDDIGDYENTNITRKTIQSYKELLQSRANTSYLLSICARDHDEKNFLAVKKDSSADFSYLLESKDTFEEFITVFNGLIDPDNKNNPHCQEILFASKNLLPSLQQIRTSLPKLAKKYLDDFEVISGIIANYQKPESVKPASDNNNSEDSESPPSSPSVDTSSSFYGSPEETTFPEKSEIEKVEQQLFFASTENKKDEAPTEEKPQNEEHKTHSAPEDELPPPYTSLTFTS